MGPDILYCSIYCVPVKFLDWKALKPSENLQPKSSQNPLITINQELASTPPTFVFPFLQLVLFWSELLLNTSDFIVPDSETNQVSNLISDINTY